MWPTTLQGTVLSIKVFQTTTVPLAWFTFLATGSTQPEIFIFWNIGDANWVSRSLNLTLLRDALVNKLQVNVTIPNATSSFINSIELVGA